MNSKELNIGETVAGCRAVLVTTTNPPWEVIPSERILELMKGNGKTGLVYYSPKGIPESQDKAKQYADCFVDCRNDMALLMKVLESCDATTIYLRVSPHTKSEFLISEIASRLAQVDLVVEFYDLSELFTDAFLSGIGGYDSEAISAARKGCAQAWLHAKAVVTKNGGDFWSGYIRGHAADRLSIIPHFWPQSRPYFQPPASRSAAKERKPPEDSCRLVYAGSISPREITHGIGSNPGANILAYIEAIARHPDISLDVFNTADRSGKQEGDRRFTPLREHLERLSPSIAYSPHIDEGTLHSRLSGYDLGLCCSHYAQDRVEMQTRVGLPNRAMICLANGLPVITDSRFEHLADLIMEYGLGIVLPPENICAFGDVVRQFFSRQSRDRLEKFRSFATKSNLDALSKLEKILTRFPDRGQVRAHTPDKGNAR